MCPPRELVLEFKIFAIYREINANFDGSVFTGEMMLRRGARALPRKIGQKNRSEVSGI
jgi:hypothetical protein